MSSCQKCYLELLEDVWVGEERAEGLQRGLLGRPGSPGPAARGAVRLLLIVKVVLQEALVELGARLWHRGGE